MSVYTATSGRVVYSIDSGSTWYAFGSGTNVRDFSEIYRKARFWGLGTRRTVDFGEIGYHGTLGIEFFLDADANIEWLEFSLGTEAPTGYSYHISSLNEGEVIYKYGNKTIKIEGYKVDTLRIASTTGELVRVSMDGMYKNRSAGSGGNISSTGGVVSFGNTVLNDGSEDVGFVNRFEVNVRNNLLEVYGLGNLKPQEIKEQRAEVNLTFDVWVDSNKWEDFIYDMQENYGFTTWKLIYTGSSNKITMAFPNMKVERITVPQRDAEVVRATVTAYSNDLYVKSESIGT